MPRESHLYQHYSWPELRQIVDRQPVVVLPIGSVEDHGHHLPLDTDNYLIWNICEEAAKRADGEILLLPLIPYGFETHHMDFPGTIDIGIEHLLHFVTDITKSVAHHGFRRILIADGHGSNMPILELAARRTNVETEAVCACFIWPSLALETIREVRESGRGGMAHAAELETSVYLHLDAEKVEMEKARKDLNMPESAFMWLDLVEGSPVNLMEHWSSFSKSGVHGDPTLANPEKGKIVFEAVVTRFLELVREFKNRPDPERTDFHAEEPT